MINSTNNNINIYRTSLNKMKVMFKLRLIIEITLYLKFNIKVIITLKVNSSVYIYICTYVLKVYLLLIMMLV